MKGSILIVEDETDIAASVAFALEQEGFSTRRAGRAGEALRIFEEERFDLIVLDVGLPDESGFDLLRRLRRKSEIPVIFLTARSEEVDRILGFELGGDDYVVKPFSPRELAARVRAVLKRSGDGGEMSPHFEVDENRQLIRFRGRHLQLSRYEYKILLLLIGRPGWIFSRDTIMEQVWDQPGESFDRTVDTHIKTIRQKLKEIDSEIDPIVTHRGSGYALREFI